jgi:hypothetical protein
MQYPPCPWSQQCSTAYVPATNPTTAATGYANLGCYAYNTTGHPGSTDLTGTSAGKMTPAECYRLSAAYDFFGLVNGRRCVGFTTLRQAAVAPANGSAACSVPCAGGAAVTCGGKTSMQLYARNKPVPQLAPGLPGEGQRRWGQLKSRPSLNQAPGTAGSAQSRSGEPKHLRTTA